MRENLTVFILPADQQSQQPLIDRAEEDLMCAICLYRQGACGYSPLLNICYMLLQVIEKWLKVFIGTQGLAGVPIRGRDSHNLQRYFGEATIREPEFQPIQTSIETIDTILLSHIFYVSLRYSETPREVESYIATLIPAAFNTRRVVKRVLKRRQNDRNEI